MSCCAGASFSPRESRGVETGCLPVCSTRVKITLLILGLLLIVVSVGVHFLHVNALAAHTIGGVGAALALGTILISSIQSLTRIKETSLLKGADAPGFSLPYFPADPLDQEDLKKCCVLPASTQLHCPKEWKLSSWDLLWNEQIELFFQYLYSKHADLEIREIVVSAERNGSLQQLNKIPYELAKSFARNGKLSKHFAFFVGLSNHFGLIFIDTTQRTFEYYDSKGECAETPEVKKVLSKMARVMHQVEGGKPYRFIPKIAIELQDDGIKCGYWVCYLLYTRIHEPSHEFTNVDEERKALDQFRDQFIAWGQKAQALVDVAGESESDCYVVFARNKWGDNPDEYTLPWRRRCLPLRNVDEKFYGERYRFRLLFAGGYMNPESSVFKDKTEKDVKSLYVAYFRAENMTNEDQEKVLHRYDALLLENLK